MQISEQERRRRSQAMRDRWADPAMRDRFLAAARGPRPGLAERHKQNREQKRKAEIERRVRALSRKLAKPATAQTDLRTMRRELDALKPLLRLGDWKKLEIGYFGMKHRVGIQRQLVIERRELARQLAQEEQANA